MIKNAKELQAGDQLVINPTTTWIVIDTAVTSDRKVSLIVEAPSGARMQWKRPKTAKHEVK